MWLWRITSRRSPCSTDDLPVPMAKLAPWLDAGVEIRKVPIRDTHPMLGRSGPTPRGCSTPGARRDLGIRSHADGGRRSGRREVARDLANRHLGCPPRPVARAQQVRRGLRLLAPRSRRAVAPLWKRDSGTARPRGGNRTRTSPKDRDFTSTEATCSELRETGSPCKSMLSAMQRAATNCRLWRQARTRTVRALVANAPMGSGVAAWALGARGHPCAGADKGGRARVRMR